jgi:hypothetical protein
MTFKILCLVIVMVIGVLGPLADAGMLRRGWAGAQEDDRR